MSYDYGPDGTCEYFCYATHAYWWRDGLSMFMSLFNITDGSKCNGDTIRASPDYTQYATFRCSDGIDNDGDGQIDINDSGCHNDNNPANPLSYSPTKDSEFPYNPPFYCGDGIIGIPAWGTNYNCNNLQEACDGTNFGSDNCQAHGYDTGS